MSDQPKKVTKARIAELQAVVDMRKQERAEAEVRLEAASQNLYQAEREFMRNEKPTPAMLKVLRDLANGASIFKGTYYPYGFLLRVPGEQSARLRDSIFYGLTGRELITSQNGGERRAEWTINDHGREMLAKWSKQS